MPKEMPARKPHRITLYVDNKGEFRWKRQAGNARVVAASTESFTTKSAMWKNLITANADQLSCVLSDQTDTGTYDSRGPLR